MVLLFTNYVILVMLDEYFKLDTMFKGLYFIEVLQQIRIYKWDKRYGCLIAAVMPLNILSFILTPLFIFIKDSKTLSRLNMFVMYGCYGLMAIFFTAIFFSCNMLLLPLAYLFAVFKKIQLLATCKTNKWSLVDLVFFFALGWLSLFLSSIVDSKDFFLHLFSNRIDKISNKIVDNNFTLNEFRIFHEIVSEIKKEAL